MKLLFLDESGDHSLSIVDIDYPVFVLGGVIVDRANYRNVIAPAIESFKNDHLSDPDVILHTTDILRARNGFEALGDPTTREKFYQGLNELMIELEYTVVACAIRKNAIVEAHRDQAIEPYAMCLEIVAGQFGEEIGDVEDGGFVFAEKRRPDLDDQLDEQWKRLCRSGTELLTAEWIERRVVDLSSKSKKLNVAGLQLADLVVSPIGRHVLGKPGRQDWAIVESKLRRVNGSYEAHGLKILP